MTENIRLLMFSFGPKLSFNSKFVRAKGVQRMSGPYVISAESYIPGAAAISHGRNTAVEAVSKAVELIGQGMKNVLITDAQGNIHTSTDFAVLVAAERK